MTEQLPSDPDELRKAARTQYFRDNPLRVGNRGIDERTGYDRVDLYNDECDAELSIRPGGICYIEWVQVDAGVQGRGIGTGLYERVQLFAQRRGLARIQAIITNETSLHAAVNAYGEGHTTEVWTDEEGNFSGEDGYAGPDHMSWVLDVDISPPQPTDEGLELAVRNREETLQLMGATGLLNDDLRRAANQQSARTHDLHDLEPPFKSE